MGRAVAGHHCFPAQRILGLMSSGSCAGTAEVLRFRTAAGLQASPNGECLASLCLDWVLRHEHRRSKRHAQLYRR